MAVGFWGIPVLITISLLIIMFRPYQREGDFDFGIIFRIFWVIPILAVWVVYLLLDKIFS